MAEIMTPSTVVEGEEREARGQQVRLLAGFLRSLLVEMWLCSGNSTHAE